MRRWVRRLLIASIIGVLLVIAGATAVVAYTWHTTELPPETPLLQTTFLTDDQGNRLATLAGGENRVEVQLNDVPVVVRQAVLDTEDHNFYKHRGVDPRGIARALWNDVRGRDLQGGSTLTQQYVKNEYAGTDRTLSRKVTEAVLAVKLEQKLSKNQILERYLNAIYFGRGAYGVEAASKAYYGKDVKDLQLPEASYLAGLIRAPELADARKQPDVAEQRRALTLGSMVRFGDITPQQQADVLAVPLTDYVIERTAQEPAVVGADKGTQYFVDYVRQQLVAKYGEKLVTSGGLRVKTTLSMNLQSQAYDSVYGNLKVGEPSGALVSIDESGAIKAMVGGRDYKASQVNLATGTAGGGSGRQAGSTFKPLELAAAVENGVSIKDTFPGPAKMTLKNTDGTNWNVANFGGESFGNIDLVTATEESVNTVYAQLVEQQGADKLATMAKKAGVTAPLNGKNNSLVLGSDPVSVVDMADAYLTFGQRGEQVTPTPILEVTTADGKNMNWDAPKKTRVMSQDTADTVNYVLQKVVQNGTGKAAAIGKPLAGKTGTTDDNGDAWFVGYTPHLATAVWMGYPESSARKMSNVRGIAVTGGTIPAQIFSNYMKQATKDAKPDGFTTPATLLTTTTIAPTTTIPPTTTTAPLPTTTAPGLRTVDPGSSRGERNRDAAAGNAPDDASTTTTVVRPGRPRTTTTTGDVGLTPIERPGPVRQ